MVLQSDLGEIFIFSVHYSSKQLVAEFFFLATMAASLQFSGVKTAPTHSFPKQTSFHCRSAFSSQLNIGSFRSTDSYRRLRHCCKSRVFKVSCERGNVDVIERNETEIKKSTLGEAKNELTCVMKFGGSSVASAERMREVADLILGFPNERPVVVLSAMGKTTNKLLLVTILFNLLILSVSVFETRATRVY